MKLYLQTRLGRDIGTSDSRGLEVDGQNSITCHLGNERLEFGVSLALVVVVRHVVEAGKLGLGHKGVALGAGVLLGRTNNH